jgi:hypothetical protein
MEKKRIGIDIGNVIVGGGGEDTSFFSDNFLKTPKIDGAFEAIQSLAEEFDVWLLSKCGQTVQDKSLAWLLHHDFYKTTGVNPEQVIFCRQRNQKAGIAKNLGFRAFIDDRNDIIDSMEGIVDQPILFTSWEEVKVRPAESFQ